MILINGVAQDYLEISDRSIQYGDGLFETIAIKQGSPVFLNQHLQRLNKGCKKLSIPCPDFSILKQEIDQVIDKQQSAVVKILISRGTGGRGYQYPEIITPTRIIARYEAPEFPDCFTSAGVKVRFCDSRLGINPNLAGIKHLNRLEQVLARSEWTSSEYQEGLMLDINNNVIEGTMSNLFIIKNHCLYTPELNQCGIKGIIRGIIFQAGSPLQLEIKESKLQAQQCYEADELFLTNSIIGIWPIKQLNEHQYKPGPITLKIRLWFEQFQDLDLCQES